MMLGISLATVTNKPGHQEREISRKTIARGMPGDPGELVVTNACAFYHCARGCGRAKRPAFPAPSWGSTAPSDLRKAGLLSKTRAHRAARIDLSCPDLIGASIDLRNKLFEGDGSPHQAR